MTNSLEVLYEDNHIIVINKRTGDIVQGDKTGDKPLSEVISDFLSDKYNKPGKAFVGIVHRLDRPVSGVVLFAKTSKALMRMNAIVKERNIKKKYWAIVLQAPKKSEDRLINYLYKNEKQNKSYTTDENHVGALRSELSYKHIASSDKYHLLQVELHTGRHHQIRVQLSNIGCIIKGDVKYGAARTNPDGSICLHARNLSFEHPVSHEQINITATVPNDNLWHYFEETIK
jgi:23S rRNA pseudouridine1911/1915/1917 synthase